MKVNIFDVAKRSGLSVVTVSRVLNHSTTVRANNRDKVLQAMKDLNYQPNAAARSLALGRTGIIGLTVTTLDDSFLDLVVKEVNDRLTEQGYFLAISVHSPDEEAIHNPLFQEDRVDGLILLSPLHEEVYVRELENKKIPFVMLDNQLENPSVPSVIVDNRKGGYDAARHLIDLGHQRIAHISGPDAFLSSRERELGFRSALEESGLEPFCIERGEFTVSSGYDIASKWLQSDNLPTAIFAADDHIALGVINALQNAGVRVPQDISVVGYDDQLIASQLHPKLTTIRQPAEKIGRHGVELLLNWILESSRPEATLASQFEPELIIRQSTARVNG
ncbi:LacI family DNA-binding transcriptional regulator [Paenibacillus wynnii]|uniref:LacI family DNA-binding transcriptional regulator n=1 Tax=Paenibacillus wynnii TaxID=268407 RepID=UPI0027D7C7FD|nr:LacI family DNA-binding transcriptional regulator [Paenibacillus wynnii]